MSLTELLVQIEWADLATLDALESAERSLRFGGRQKVLTAIAARRRQLERA